MSDLERHLSELMEDQEFADEYNALEEQYSFARQVIEAVNNVRKAAIASGMTQAELARKVGTSQANISKLEHGTLNPSFEMARRVAAGLGKRLCVSMQ